ncbi:peptide chain release factor H [Rhodobacterales bacterium]|nr:peptide chain release factor H [Rhodobacterales bacterium]
MSFKSECRLLVTSGDGPLECRRAVDLALHRMKAEAHQAGLHFEIETETGNDGGIASAVVTLVGEDTDRFARHWSGTVQWVCESPYRPHHKRRNWFIGIFALPTGIEPEVDLSPQALRVETFRSGGPGGQHQNTIDSGVRITHLDTGLSAVSTDERSQHRNRQRAMERLKTRFLLKERETAARDRTDRNQLHGRLERGNPVRVFQGSGFRERK